MYAVRDGTECPIHILDLHQSEGDEVFITGYKQPGHITAIDRWDTEGYVRVRVDTGELNAKDGSIKIHESAIDKDWGRGSSTRILFAPCSRLRISIPPRTNSSPSMGL